MRGQCDVNRLSAVMLSNVTRNTHLKLDRIAALCVVSSENQFLFIPYSGVGTEARVPILRETY